MSSIPTSNETLIAPAHPPLPDVRVHSLTPQVEELWNSFVLEHPRGTLFHLLAWKRTIEKTFGYEASYAYTERDGEITGVAPVFFISNWLLGRCLISTPYAVYGGICATDVESEEKLVEHIKQLLASGELDSSLRRAEKVLA